METKKMKNSEVIELLQINNVGLNNVKSFCNKKKLNVKQCRQLLEKMQEKQAKKVKKMQAKKFGFSVKQYGILREKAMQILKSFDTCHSMGCYKTFKINYVRFVENDDLQTYSRSCKYKPTYGNIVINLSKKELINIELIDSVWTIPGKNHKAIWLKSVGTKQSYDVVKDNGFLFGKSHGSTLLEAKELFKLRLIAKKREKLGNQKFIGIVHLKIAGACDAGINNFIARHKLNAEYGYNIGYLKSLENNLFLNNL